MNEVLNIYKPQGLTPLQVLNAMRDKWLEYRGEKMTYAGRLDPMAEGVLIVLIGEMVYKKEEYLKLDKIYEADIVFELGTDTHDLLGMPMFYPVKNITREEIEKEIRKMEGTFEYTLPIYSSKPVQGKPLFQWAREDRLGEIEIPKRAMCVYGIELLDQYEITDRKIMEDVEASIKKVHGDFRQSEIVSKWKAMFAGADVKGAFPAVKIRVHCASGTYIRTLAYELGKRLGTDAVVTRLIRISVGDFTIDTSKRLK